ncbi:MAG: DNA cytosine methyltransferase [Hormoscilla sp.]
MSSETKKERPIAVDLCAGAGGMTLGFEQAGFDVLASVDIDPIHCAIHEYNFPFWSVLCQNIVETTEAEIRSRSQIGDREIDVVLASLPTSQVFSTMGKRAASEKRNSVLYNFQRLVAELKPKYFVMENDRGLAIGRQKQRLKNLIKDLREAGYQVQEDYKSLNAANYGIPEARERLFLLGCRSSEKLPKYPLATTKPAKPRLRDRHRDSDLPLGPTVWDALSDLPEAKNYPELVKQDWTQAEYGKPSNYAKGLSVRDFLADNYGYDREYDRQLLTSSMLTKHSLRSMKRFENTKQGQREKISRFQKLHPEGICNSLRGGTDRTQGSFTAPRPIHPYVPRCITVREAARLHSYPDWFRFHATKWHGFRQVANSVPPLLAKAVAAEIIRALGVVPSSPTGKLLLGDEKLLELTNSQASQRYRS